MASYPSHAERAPRGDAPGPAAPAPPAMAVQTYAEQLEQVQAAIRAIEMGCQSYTIDNRQLTRANLADLYKREERLRTLAAREARGGMRVRYAVPLG